MRNWPLQPGAAILTSTRLTVRSIVPNFPFMFVMLRFVNAISLRALALVLAGCDGEEPANRNTWWGYGNNPSRHRPARFCFLLGWRRRFGSFDQD